MLLNSWPSGPGKYIAIEWRSWSSSVMTERFSMDDPALLRYEFTVDDPENFTAPWTVLTYLRRDAGVVYEYACHEGNMRNMQGILKGSRVMETAGE